jgi:hypothetical protein
LPGSNLIRATDCPDLRLHFVFLNLPRRSFHVLSNSSLVNLNSTLCVLSYWKHH